MKRNQLLKYLFRVLVVSLFFLIQAGSNAATIGVDSNGTLQYQAEPGDRSSQIAIALDSHGRIFIDPDHQAPSYFAEHANHPGWTSVHDEDGNWFNAYDSEGEIPHHFGIHKKNLRPNTAPVELGSGCLPGLPKVHDDLINSEWKDFESLPTVACVGVKKIEVELAPGTKAIPSQITSKLDSDDPSLKITTSGEKAEVGLFGDADAQLFLRASSNTVISTGSCWFADLEGSCSDVAAKRPGGKIQVEVSGAQFRFFAQAGSNRIVSSSRSNDLWLDGGSTSFKATRKGSVSRVRALRGENLLDVRSGSAIVARPKTTKSLFGRARPLQSLMEKNVWKAITPESRNDGRATYRGRTEVAHSRNFKLVLSDRNSTKNIRKMKQAQLKRMISTTGVRMQCRSGVQIHGWQNYLKWTRPQANGLKYSSWKLRKQIRKC